MSGRTLVDDCFVHDRQKLTHGEAITILSERLGPIAGSEQIALNEAGGRIIAADYRTPRPIPAHDNAAVDGFAVRHADLDTRAPTPLPVARRIAAGVQDRIPQHQPETATQIFTGAVMPDGADTVIMQEDCNIELDEGGLARRVVIPPGIKQGANWRQAGEDIQRGESLAQAGIRLRPQDLARLASAGAGRIEVFKALRIGLYSTGDEIRPAGDDDLPAGAVFDANQPMLAGLARSLPVEVYPLGILPDRAEAVQGALAAASERFDAVITSGGASVGAEDHLRTALQTLGACHMWQLAIKPGRPMMMGQIGAMPVFGLPGNPVAVLVCWLLYVHPALLALGGAPWKQPEKIMLPAGFSVPRKKTGRREFFRGWLETAGDRTVLKKFERDGSGLIAGLQAATGLIEVPEDAQQVATGDRLAFLPFAQFGICVR